MLPPEVVPIQRHDGRDAECSTSRLALGTVQWGLHYGIANRVGCPDVDEVRSMLQTARDAGVDTLDTARAYGKSESVIGECLAGDDSWTVVTKLTPQLTSSMPRHALSECVEQSLRESRDALRRSRLDAILLHRFEHIQLGYGVVWDALRREREAGSIGRLGASALTPDEAWEILEQPELEAIQVASNLLDQRLTRQGFFEAAVAAGRTVFVRSVFLQGVAHLAEDDLPPHLSGLRPALRAIHNWCEQRGLSIAEAFLAFAAVLPGVNVLVGCESQRQLAETLGMWKRVTTHNAPIADLAAELPDIPDHLLNPASWPKAA